MKTQPRESIKQAIRDAFIVSTDPTEPETDDFAKMTWREAGQFACIFAGLGILMFGLHYLAFGKGEGTPSRNSLISGFTVVTAIFGIAKIDAWKIRVRFLAALTSALAVVGLFFRFVVHDPIAFSPIHLAAIVGMLVLMWIGFDAYRRRKSR